MLPDLLALARWCDVLPDRIDEAVNTAARDITIAMATDLIWHTPVDITTAASNWQASLNSPAFLPLPAIFPGERGSTAEASRSEALAHVKRAIAPKRAGEPIFLSNLTDYILDLNMGSSRQEPPGFLERGILVAERFAQAYQLRINA